ncbi:MAG: transporter substrate-binding domain-containing protein [Actinomycetia bacterium]|nr:transporter substrate-binding domain-containing protein [Actinomycetes bacterium]
MNRHLAVAAVIAAAALTLTGCTKPGNPASPGTNTSGSTPAVTLVAPGTLTVCTNPPFPPLEDVDASGKVVGFDLDLMGVVADALGAKVNVIQAEFSQITSGAVFAAKKCDIGASGITINDARKQAVTFSRPYFSATQALAVKSDSGITGLDGLSGKTVAVQTDTTGADYADANKDKYGYTVMVFDDAGTALNSLLSGRAQAAIVDKAVVYSFVASNPTTQVATEFQTGELYGFAAKGNDANATALIGLVNDALAKADTDGTYLRIYKTWIDPLATTAPLPPA